MPLGLDIAMGAFGLGAGVALAGGFIVLRLARDRYQFRLMQTALEKGITSLPGSPPAWLISLRQGVLTLALGIGLMLMGAAVHVAANRIQEAPLDTAPAVQPSPPRAEGPGADRAPEQPAPPRPDPEMERWHRVETQRLAGVLSGSAGVILTMLGIVRIVFARTEKKYTV